MNVVLQRLLQEIESCREGSTDHHLALALLQNSEKIDTVSIGEMAKTCAVSKSTVSKFVRKMGFEDYADFKLEARRAHERDPYVYSRENVNTATYILKHGESAYLDVLFRDMRGAFDGANDEAIDELVHDLHTFAHLASFGEGYSQLACLSLQQTMGFYRRFVFTTQNDATKAEYIQNAGPDTCILVVSNSGMFISSYAGLEGNPEKDLFNRTRARVYLLTSNPEMENDPRLYRCILNRFSETLQNHIILNQIVIQQIELAYHRRYGFPQDYRDDS